MSTTSHQAIFIKIANDEYKPYENVSKLCYSYEGDMEINDLHRNKVFTINPGLAKDYLITNGHRVDKPDFVSDDYKGYTFVEYTLSEIDEMAQDMIFDALDKKKDEDVMYTITQYAKRLGIGKESEYNENLHADIQEMVEDKLWMGLGLYAFKRAILAVVQEGNEKYVSEFDIKIIIWNS